jgi:hypothetical protein
VLAEYAEHYNSHRPHRTLGQAAPLWNVPDLIDAGLGCQVGEFSEP